jgi:hypothetical protein
MGGHKMMSRYKNNNNCKTVIKNYKKIKTLTALIFQAMAVIVIVLVVRVLLIMMTIIQ